MGTADQEAETEEAGLIERARSGQSAAAEQLLRDHLPKISSICRRMCTSPSDAEDATQEAMIAIARGVRRFDGRSSFSTWVYRVTTNACLDEIRRHKRRPVPSDAYAEVATPSEEDPAQRVEQYELRDQLSEALADLPEEYRVAVILRDLADLEYGDIASVLELNLGTVKSRIARGRARLARQLGDNRADIAHAGTNRPAESSESQRQHD